MVDFSKPLLGYPELGCPFGENEHLVLMRPWPGGLIRVDIFNRRTRKRAGGCGFARKPQARSLNALFSSCGIDHKIHEFTLKRIPKPLIRELDELLP
jgi:hypothetical protein